MLYEVITLQELTAESVQLASELAGKMKTLLLGFLEKNPLLLSELNMPSWYMGTVNGGKLHFYDGELRVVDERGAIGAEFTTTEYRDFLVERAVTNSYAKEVYLNA